MGDTRHISCGACGVDEPRPMGVPRMSGQAKLVTPDWESMRVVQCRQCGFYTLIRCLSGMKRLCKCSTMPSTLARKAAKSSIAILLEQIARRSAVADDHQVLAQHVVDLPKDNDFRQRVGARAREFVRQKFTRDSVSQRVAEIESCIGRRNHG